MAGPSRPTICTKAGTTGFTGTWNCWLEILGGGTACPRPRGNRPRPSFHSRQPVQVHILVPVGVMADLLQPRHVAQGDPPLGPADQPRSEEHTSALQSLTRNSYA